MDLQSGLAVKPSGHRQASVCRITPCVRPTPLGCRASASPVSRPRSARNFGGPAPMSLLKFSPTLTSGTNCCASWIFTNETGRATRSVSIPSSADFLRVARRRMDLCWTWMRFSTRKGCTVWLAIGRQRSTRAVYNSYGGEGKGRSRRPARRNSACASPSVQLSLRVSISAIDEQPFVTDSAANRLRRHLRIGDIFLPKNS